MSEQNNHNGLLHLVEHPDRVAWYMALIEEWTGQVPGMAKVNGDVAVWVKPYTSQAGVLHPVPTQVWHTDVELALETLSNYLYEDLQLDCQSNQHAMEDALVAVG